MDPLTGAGPATGVSTTGVAAFAGVDVPPKARMALVFVGLLGGTGQASFDDLQIHPAAENPSVLPGKPLP